VASAGTGAEVTPETVEEIRRRWILGRYDYFSKDKDDPKRGEQQDGDYDVERLFLRIAELERALAEARQTADAVCERIAQEYLAAMQSVVEVYPTGSPEIVDEQNLLVRQINAVDKVKHELRAALGQRGGGTPSNH
jgi:hypothetical protein